MAGKGADVWAVEIKILGDFLLRRAAFAVTISREL
jgi:hypothetical protein